MYAEIKIHESPERKPEGEILGTHNKEAQEF
jgi:hypothetical protein